MKTKLKCKRCGEIMSPYAFSKEDKKSFNYFCKGCNECHNDYSLVLINEKEV